MTHTIKQVQDLTEADVAKAKERFLEARKTRTGLSTIDFHLSQVGNSSAHTLEAAKFALMRIAS